MYNNYYNYIINNIINNFNHTNLRIILFNYKISMKVDKSFQMITKNLANIRICIYKNIIKYIYINNEYLF